MMGNDQRNRRGVAGLRIGARSEYKKQAMDEVAVSDAAWRCWTGGWLVAHGGLGLKNNEDD